MEPGNRIGKYVVEAKLGAGGNGTVYAARDAVLGRRVALKLLHPQLVYDAQIAARFRQEAQAMAQLNHPHVVIVHDFVGEANHWAIVMELVEHGETLASILKREGRLDPLRAAHLVAQVAAGLGHAHARGIVHRDVKPANVLVVRDGQRETAKLTDFGIARIMDGERRTQAQLTLGTLWYIAPEQAQNSSVDARADVYSLGATLYEALTGRVVFPYDNAARVLAAHMSEAPVPPSTLAPAVPRVLESFTLRCVAKRPEDRPAHGDAMSALLTDIEREMTMPRSFAPIAATVPSSHSPVHGGSESSSARGGIATTHVAASPFGLSPTPSHPSGIGSTPRPGLGMTPQPLDAAAQARARADGRVGLWVGVGGVALIAMTCLLGSFLCIVTGFLQR